MTEKPTFDVLASHKYFSAYCFNRAWDFIDKTVRTAEEDDAMLQLSLSSLWHWTQRDDCTAANLSVGYWQVSRVFALLRQADKARDYGKLCLEAATQKGVQAYFAGTAYEALARAESIAGNREAMENYLTQAHRIADSLTDQEEQQMLRKDLESIQ